MENLNIACDPEIGPELVSFLTDKVKTTREALNASLRENEALKAEITKLKESETQLRPKVEEALEYHDQLSGVACRIGQCQSKDEADSLRTQLMEVQATLAATQQALEESAISFVDAERNYKRVKSRLRERQNTIEGLQEQLGRCLKEMKQSEERYLKSSVGYQLTDSNGGGPVVHISCDQPPVPLRWMTQLCMPPEMLPTTLPQNLRAIANQGVLYRPGKCSVDHVKGFATIYAGKTLYQPGNGKGNGKWLPRNDALLAHLVGTTREVFDLADYGIRYVGTFKACQNVSELGTEEYRALSVEIRTHIIGACASPGPSHDPKLSDIDRTKIADKYWAGEAKVQYLRWERNGFNMTLFHTLVALRELNINSAKEGQTSAKKRGKRGQASGGKKRKLDETGESISCKR